MIATAIDCHLCGEPLDHDSHWNSDWHPTIDHVIPISLGGRDVRSNVAVAHRWCNSRRGNQTIDEFREQIAA
jgi:5-methylcytosine-specific restriction endonuclease McrA